MSATYINIEELEDVFRQYGYTRVPFLDELKTVSEEEILEDISSFSLIQALGKKENIVATQIWQKEDIAAALSKEYLSTDNGLVKRVADEVRPALENCSNGWEQIHAVIDRIVKEN